jgi:uncharacterized protein YjbJ (UPF0337 family)
MSGKTDVVKGRLKEAAGALTGNDELREEGQDRSGRRQGQASRREGCGKGRGRCEKSERVKL